MRLRPLLVLAGLVAACAAPPAAPEASNDASRLVPALSAAFGEEAHGDPAKATAAYLDLVDAAAAARPDGYQLAVTAAALDALVFRSVGAFASISSDAALVYRTKDPSLTRGDSLASEERRREGARPEERARESIATRLAAAYGSASGPFVRGLLAEAMTSLAEHRGDIADASRWREWSGCAREATVVGPLDWAPLTGVTGADPLASFDGKLAAGYAGPGGFGVVSPPIVVRGRGCSIELAAASSNAGVRDVLVDVVVPRPQRIGVMLRSAATATLRVGGKVVLERPYELGGGDVSRFAWVDVPSGTVRVVARVGMDQEGESVRIAVWDDAGHPLHLRAPRPSEGATVEARAGEAVPYPTPKTGADELAVALAALANQDPRTAEYVLEHDATDKSAPPDLALAYGRAVEQARDLGLVHRIERARTAYERVLATWPGAWEAIVAHAWLAGARRGPGDARFAELEDLAALRGHAHDVQAAGAGHVDDAILDVFELAASGRERLFDRARDVGARLERSLGGAALLSAAERVAFERSPADQADFDCAPHPGVARPRGDLACYTSLRARGDMKGALAELERLRGVLGGIDLFLPFTLRDALALGLHDEADRAVRDMLPSEVTLSSLYGLASLDPKTGTPPTETRALILARAGVAHDAPIAIAPLSRALHDDPTAPFAGIAEAVVHEDRAHPVLPGAATAVLRHSERYDVARTGVVHAIVFDVRRVNGTADVEENAQAGAPSLTGRTSLRILRRRVLKRDGNVVEPDPNPGASQGHADLAQLEAGDVVEAIYEGWSIPLETGEIGIDTVDLLPSRTAVHQATVEIHLPVDLKVALWSHPILGAPQRETRAVDPREGGGNETVLRWSLQDHLARRVEDATPKMDRSVGVSLSTATWSQVGRGLREAVLARVDHDPAVVAWASGVVKDAHAATDRAKVAAIVLAAGQAVKEGDPGDLSDLLYGHATGPQSVTARGILADHEGSRTWLVVRALRELGVPCEVAVAENEPWSASVDFPPHLGRFLHPLAIAHVRPGPGEAGADIAIDADVSGPPLPAGHISPELRGRLALHEDGSVSPLPESSGEDERDEIDERLVLDARGDAKGTFTILLRGRDAQDIAEALERNVGDPRRRALRGIVLAWVPFANVDAVELSSTEGSWQVALRAEITIPGYAQAEGKPTAAGTTWDLPGLEPIHDVYPRGSSSTLSATYASEGTRESALAVSRAVQYHAHRRVELPAGASVVRVPGPFEVKTRALAATRKLLVTTGAANGGGSAAGPVLEDDVALGVPTGTVAASAYAAFVADAHRTDDAWLATTRVRVPSPAKR